MSEGSLKHLGFAVVTTSIKPEKVVVRSTALMAMADWIHSNWKTVDPTWTEQDVFEAFERLKTLGSAKVVRILQQDVSDESSSSNVDRPSP